MLRLLAEAQAAGFSLGRAKIISLNSMQVSYVCLPSDSGKKLTELWLYHFKLQARNILGEEGEKAELLCSGPTLAMELVMEDAVNKFAQLANDKVAMQCSFSQGS